MTHRKLLQDYTLCVWGNDITLIRLFALKFKINNKSS